MNVESKKSAAPEVITLDGGDQHRSWLAPKRRIPAERSTTSIADEEEVTTAGLRAKRAKRPEIIDILDEEEEEEEKNGAKEKPRETVTQTEVIK